MNLKQSVRCQMQMDSQWIQTSVVFMGLCVFLKAVYYLGLTNFQDLDGFQLITQLIVPVVVAAVYLILIKGLNLNSPALLGILSGLYAVDYLLAMEQNEIVSAILLAANVVAFLATVYGFFQDTRLVVIIGVVSMIYRVVVVDFVGYIFPLSDWHIISYIPVLANMFAVFAIGFLSPALQLTQRRKQPIEDTNETPTEQPSESVTTPDPDQISEEAVESTSDETSLAE